MLFIHDKLEQLQTITKIMNGKNPIAVVAYVGDGVLENFKKIKTRFVINAYSEGSNPHVVKSLLAKNGSKRVRNISTLHAKIYCSSVGAYVGSNNASKFGLWSSNFNTDGHLEAGVFIPAISTKIEFQKIRDYCEKLFLLESEPIDKTVLENCIRSFKTRSSNKRFSIQKKEITFNKIIQNLEIYTFIFVRQLKNWPSDNALLKNLNISLGEYKGEQLFLLKDTNESRKFLKKRHMVHESSGGCFILIEVSPQNKIIMNKKLTAHHLHSIDLAVDRKNKVTATILWRKQRIEISSDDQKKLKKYLSRFSLPTNATYCTGSYFLEKNKYSLKSPNDKRKCSSP